MKNTILSVLATTLLLSAGASADRATSQSEMAFDLSPTLIVSPSTTNEQSLPLYQDQRTLREKLLLSEESPRTVRYNNSWVDSAPSAWPYPMVVNTRRPVLPGSAW